MSPIGQLIQAMLFAPADSFALSEATACATRFSAYGIHMIRLADHADLAKIPDEQNNSVNSVSDGRCGSPLSMPIP